MTQKTKAALTTDITTNLADNTTGAITASVMRTMIQNLVDSYSDLALTGMQQVATASVNFNSANTDNAIAITLPSGFTRYKVDQAVISGASGTLTTATCGLFTATAAGGTAIVTSATAITVATASEGTNNNTQSLTVNNAGTQSYTTTPLQFRVQTPQGVAATATVTIFYRPVS